MYPTYPSPQGSDSQISDDSSFPTSPFSQTDSIPMSMAMPIPFPAARPGTMPGSLTGSLSAGMNDLSVGSYPGEDESVVGSVTKGGNATSLKSGSVDQPKVRAFACYICFKAFYRSEHLNRHLRIHTGEKPYECDHMGCGKKFGRRDELTRHTKMHRKPSKSKNLLPPGSTSSNLSISIPPPNSIPSGPISQQIQSPLMAANMDNTPYGQTFPPAGAAFQQSSGLGQRPLTDSHPNSFHAHSFTNDGEHLNLPHHGTGESNSDDESAYGRSYGQSFNDSVPMSRTISCPGKMWNGNGQQSGDSYGSGSYASYDDRYLGLGMGGGGGDLRRSVSVSEHKRSHSFHINFNGMAGGAFGGENPGMHAVGSVDTDGGWSAGHSRQSSGVIGGGHHHSHSQDYSQQPHDTDLTNSLSGLHVGSYPLQDYSNNYTHLNSNNPLLSGDHRRDDDSLLTPHTDNSTHQLPSPTSFPLTPLTHHSTSSTPCASPGGRMSLSPFQVPSPTLTNSSVMQHDGNQQYQQQHQQQQHQQQQQQHAQAHISGGIGMGEEYGDWGYGNGYGTDGGDRFSAGQGLGEFGQGTLLKHEWS
ncbi:hypothetical protein HK097_007425 [Rhizophlyctis rosea]|uniref:C2H2-type domain-containing protein n=1 Tax=Rhizophlyctis rosea TaxID=64517 RepID=A0AAD5SD27_9FUNG|nr:hypothetical protein HK097_007425 [Rhizophlyctis rosea]